MHWIPRLICAASKIGVNHNPCYMYRKERPGSLFASVSPKTFFDAMTIIEEILNWLKSKNGKTRVCQVVYKGMCIQVWILILSRLFLIVTDNRQDSIILLKMLKKFSYVLLHRISFYKAVCYFLIHFINGDIKKYMIFVKVYKSIKK
jgi:hypothetical protein